MNSSGGNDYSTVYEGYDSCTVSGYPTIDNLVNDSKNQNQPHKDAVHGWIQGNTIVSDHYNMQYLGTSGSFQGSVLVVNNAKTISGLQVDNVGKIANQTKD